jgi:hypothetical protein
MTATTGSTREALAYVFWHRPSRRASSEDYRRALVEFHDRLAIPSASFWRAKLPFEETDGYEDWYLVEDWAALGDLNLRALDDERRDRHDVAAGLMGAGWGGIYALVRGRPEIPETPRWLTKPLGEPVDDFLAAVEEPVVWQRQMVLGPAPEFCLAAHLPTTDDERVV